MSITRRRLLVYAVMIFSLLMAINLIKDIVRLGRSDQRLVAAEAELQEAKKEQEELKRSLLAVSDGFWLESQIRNVLKMAKPDEIVVVVPEEVTRVDQVPPSVSAKEAGKETNWAQWLEVFGF